MAWSFQCGTPNFVTFNLELILTYSIDSICLAFVVNGGRCQQLEDLYSMASQKYFMLSYYLC